MSLSALRDFVLRHEKLFVLTGAGCSTGSGIPDYRDPSGAWKRKQPVTLAEFMGSEAARRRYWARSLIGWGKILPPGPTARTRPWQRLEARGKSGCW